MTTSGHGDEADSVNVLVSQARLWFHQMGRSWRTRINHQGVRTPAFRTPLRGLAGRAIGPIGVPPDLSPVSINTSFMTGPRLLNQAHPAGNGLPPECGNGGTPWVLIVGAPV